MDPRRISEPSNRLARFAAVALSVAVVGSGIAALAAFIAAQVMKGRATMIGDIVAVVVSLLIAYPSGVGIGIILVRKMLKWRGSVVLGIAGAFVAAVLTMVAAEPLHLNVNTQVLMSVYFVTVAVCAAAGFLYRR
ncbi:MAG: hypothetical protein JW846_09835 [Dehalococcoidia bacterium]|nr:hypothetical protein [Dehalococcoidia bacterium]